MYLHVHLFLDDQLYETGFCPQLVNYELLMGPTSDTESNQEAQNLRHLVLKMSGKVMTLKPHSRKRHHVTNCTYF